MNTTVWRVRRVRKKKQRIALHYHIHLVSIWKVEVDSGVTKGPADPAVREGAILGGRQIVVWIWDNFENLTKVLAKLRILL